MCQYACLGKTVDGAVTCVSFFFTNSYCLALKFVAENLKDEIEDGMAGRHLKTWCPIRYLFASR